MQSLCSKDTELVCDLWGVDADHLEYLLDDAGMVGEGHGLARFVARKQDEVGVTRHGHGLAVEEELAGEPGKQRTHRAALWFLVADEGLPCRPVLERLASTRGLHHSNGGALGGTYTAAGKMATATQVLMFWYRGLVT